MPIAKNDKFILEKISLSKNYLSQVPSIFVKAILEKAGEIVHTALNFSLYFGERLLENVVFYFKLEF